MRLQGMVGDHITIRPAGSGWRPPDWITNPELQESSHVDAPFKQHKQPFVDENARTPRSEMHRRSVRHEHETKDWRQAGGGRDLLRRMGRRPDDYDVELGGERDALLVDRDPARGGTAYQRRKLAAGRAVQGKRNGFARHGNLTYWQRILALALSLFVGLSLLGIIATLLSAKLDVLETKLDSRGANVENKLYPASALPSIHSAASTAASHGRKLLDSGSALVDSKTGIETEGTGLERESTLDSLLSSVATLGNAISTFVRVSKIVREENSQPVEPPSTTLLIGSMNAASEMAGKADYRGIPSQMEADPSSLGPRPSAEDVNRLSATLKVELQKLLSDMMNGKASAPLQIPGSSESASPVLLASPGTPPMPPQLQLINTATNMDSIPRNSDFIPAVVNQPNGKFQSQSRKSAGRNIDGSNPLSGNGVKLFPVQMKEHSAPVNLENAQLANFSPGEASSKERKGFGPVPVAQRGLFPSHGGDSGKHPTEVGGKNAFPRGNISNDRQAVPGAFPGALDELLHPSNGQGAGIASSIAANRGEMASQNSKSPGASPQRIEMWEVASGKAICRIYKACKMQDGSVILPQWMERHQEKLKSDCGVSKAKFLLDNSPGAFNIRHEKKHFPTGKHLSFDHASRDVFGQSAPRDHMPHFVTDSLKPLASIEAILGSGRGKLPLSVISPETGGGKPAINKGAFQEIEPSLQLYEGTLKRESSEWVPGVVSMFENVGFHFAPAGMEKPDEKNSKALESTGTCFRSLITNNLKQYSPHGILDANNQNIVFTSSGLERRDVAELSSPSETSCAISVTALTRSGPRALLNLGELRNSIAAMGNQMGITAELRVVDFSEGVPFEDQVHIVESSNVLIATHGAGNANFIFMRPNATVIEIFPFSYRAGPFNMFAEIFGLDYRYAMAAPQTDVFKECMNRHEKKSDIRSYVFNLWDQAVAVHRQQPGVHMLHFETEFGKPGQSEGMTTRKCARMQELEFDVNQVASMVLDAARQQCQKAIAMK